MAIKIRNPVKQRILLAIKYFINQLLLLLFIINIIQTDTDLTIVHSFFLFSSFNKIDWKIFPKNSIQAHFITKLINP